ncbi:MAG: MBL fold metallo-hydrolase [Bacteroidales bacterium]|nr:MBL fold metallo-hydrolase [Bacteroidales bacterium]
MIQIKQFVFNHYQTNCFLLFDEATRESAIVDPCALASYEDAQLDQYIERNSLKVKYILLTHAHVDHLAGLAHACDTYHLPVHLHKDSLPFLQQAPVYAPAMGFDLADLGSVECVLIHEGSKLMLGESEIECREVPGHLEGSMAFVLHQERHVITGDALFCGSIGRTDLPGGSFDKLILSIRERLLVLDDDYAVLPGHGDFSTIGDERNNPFLFEY